MTLKLVAEYQSVKTCLTDHSQRPLILMMMAIGKVTFSTMFGSKNANYCQLRPVARQLLLTKINISAAATAQWAAMAGGAP